MVEGAVIAAPWRHLAHPPSLAQRGSDPNPLADRAEQLCECQILSSHGRLEGGVVDHRRLLSNAGPIMFMNYDVPPTARVIDDPSYVHWTAAK
jgi:hypothetical protein